MGSALQQCEHSSRGSVLAIEIIEPRSGRIIGFATKSSIEEGRTHCRKAEIFQTFGN